jgi:hypothetical protein
MRRVGVGNWKRVGLASLSFPEQRNDVTGLQCPRVQRPECWAGIHDSGHGLHGPQCFGGASYLIQQLGDNLMTRQCLGVRRPISRIRLQNGGNLLNDLQCLGRPIQLVQ